MAINSFLDISPLTGQFKQDLSFIAKSQINSLKGIPGAFNAQAAMIKGDISGVFNTITNSARSMTSIGTMLAANFETTGLVNKITSNFNTSVLPSSIVNKIPVSTSLPQNPVNLDEAFARLPPASIITDNLPINKMAEKLKNIVGDFDLSYAGITFPSDLDIAERTYLQLSFHDYSRDDQFKPAKSESPFNIMLPIPDNFSEAHSLRYDSIQEMGATVDAYRAISPRDKKKITEADAFESDIKTFLQKFPGEGSKIASRLALRAGLSGLSELSGLGFNGLPEVVESQLFGFTPDPHPSIFFKGVNLREFQWNWKLVPRNETEAINIQNILKEIKKATLPTRNTNGWGLNFPKMVKPRVVGKGEDDMMKFKFGVISGISINYTAEGTSAFFKDGKPVSIQLSLEIKEIEQYLAEDEK